MKTRRKFLIQGGMAATALLAVNPFEAFSGNTSLVNFSGNGTSLMLLHTGNVNSNSHYLKTTSQIAALKNENRNVMLVNAGEEMPERMQHINFDVSSAPEGDALHNKGDYRIMYKGDIKIGVITAGATSVAADPVAIVNKLSAWLKKEKNCDLVVCLSQLGYKNNNSADDLTLAARSKNLDIIIGGNSKKISPAPVIALNSNNEEVILHYADALETGLGKIAIGFNRQKQKNSIAF